MDNAACWAFVKVYKYTRKGQPNPYVPRIGSYVKFMKVDRDSEDIVEYYKVALKKLFEKKSFSAIRHY